MTMWPRLIGHRGAMAHAPENTLASIAKAAELGVTMVEIDAKLSADGVPMVIHDERLERLTDGQGRVRDTNAEALGRLDAGTKFDAAFAGERIPTLEAVLRLCLDLDLGINIEIKPCPGRSLETAERVMQVAASVWPEDRDPPLLSSFIWPCLEVARAVRPDWPRGLLIGMVGRRWQDWVPGLDVATLNIGDVYVDWDRGGMARYLEPGLPVLIWTVNDRAAAKRFLDAGATSIITDDPVALADL
jgi:glycerophosphoryl diester phosphodiesterase